MPQYWVVGAMWGGHDDQFDLFIQKGYWLLGWDPDEQPVQLRRRDQIRPGDHIAIKKRIGSNLRNIEIRALGIVKRIDPKSHRVYVRWAQPDLHRQVPSKGCYASIHGPFSSDDEWTQLVFHAENGHASGGDDLPDVDDEPLLGPEGAKRWRWHLVTERNRGIVKRKKAQVKRDKGSLECEVCDLSFAEFYGDVGADFCEVHHRFPLSHLDGPVVPKLDDLTIICSNCHRMIHRTKPMMSVEDFRDFVKNRRGNRREFLPRQMS
jgi:hypothetical protein